MIKQWKYLFCSQTICSLLNCRKNYIQMTIKQLLSVSDLWRFYLETLLKELPHELAYKIQLVSCYYEHCIWKLTFHPSIKSWHFCCGQGKNNQELFHWNWRLHDSKILLGNDTTFHKYIFKGNISGYFSLENPQSRK